MSYYVVTGAAGFIGSRLVKGLNDSGATRILAVDNLQHGDKFRNLASSAIADYVDQDDLLDALEDLSGAVRAVLHQGACSETTVTDGRYVMKNNYEYSKRLLEWCLDEDVPFLYASSAAVYGPGPEFKEDPDCEKPLNLYAYSKTLFDRYVRGFLSAGPQVVGLRYFNVYGPNEWHKASYSTNMASVAYQAYHQFRADGVVRLFVGSGGYADGEQRRDFVHVDDVVAVNLWMLEHPHVSGIFNCGTGRAQTFNEVAAAVVNTVRGTDASPAELARQGLIRYVAFPPALAGKYQSHTQANLARLRATGFSRPFLDVQAGVSSYVKELMRA